MHKVAVIGAGKIGSTVVDLLTAFGAYEVLVIDGWLQLRAAISLLTPFEVWSLRSATLHIEGRNPVCQYSTSCSANQSPPPMNAHNK